MFFTKINTPFQLHMRRLVVDSWTTAAGPAPTTLISTYYTEYSSPFSRRVKTTGFIIFVSYRFLWQLVGIILYNHGNK